MTSDHNQQVFAQHYRASSYRPQAGYFEALHRTRLQMLQDHLAPGARVLDLGCGSGAYLLPLHQLGHDVTGIDYSPGILAELRADAVHHGIDPATLQVTFGDARAMPLPDASFDAVFSFATLYAIPDVERVLDEIHRVLRPGGVAWLELGNARSLNAIEADRIGNGLTCRHLPPGRMRHLLRHSGLAVQRVRCFQLFPLWGGGTDRARTVLNPTLADALAARVADGDALLDEVVSSSSHLAPFAFRQLWCVQKDGNEVPESPVVQVPSEDPLRRERRREAALAVAADDIASALQLLLANVMEAPEDPRSPLAIAGLFDGDAERRLVRRWRRLLLRSGRWPAVGAPLTPAPIAAPTAPKLSVVLPTHDAAHLLPEAVQSVFGQTFADFELIVVDDGSRDHTQRYLQRIDDPRLTVVRQSNQRLPTALNRGFALARGELRTWLSADNVCLPTMFADLVRALDEHATAQLAVGGFARVDQRLAVRSVIIGQDLSLAGFLPRNPGVAAFAYRSATARQVGDYAADLEGAEDWDYWLRLLEHGPCVAVPAVLYLYREHARSMSSTIPDRVRDSSELAFARVLQRHGGLPALSLLDPAAAAADPRARATAWFRLGTRLLESPFAPASAAVAALEQAVRSDPTDGRSLVQLAIALARAGATDGAARLALRFAEAPDAGLRQLAQRLQSLAAMPARPDAANLPLLPLQPVA